MRRSILNSGQSLQTSSGSGSMRMPRFRGWRELRRAGDDRGGRQEMAPRSGARRLKPECARASPLLGAARSTTLPGSRSAQVCYSWRKIASLQCVSTMEVSMVTMLRRLGRYFVWVRNLKSCLHDSSLPYLWERLPNQLSPHNRGHRTAFERVTMIRRITALRKRLIHIVSPLAIRRKDRHIRRSPDFQRPATES